MKKFIVQSKEGVLKKGTLKECLRKANDAKCNSVVKKL